MLFRSKDISCIFSNSYVIGVARKITNKQSDFYLINDELIHEDQKFLIYDDSSEKMFFVSPEELLKIQETNKNVSLCTFTQEKGIQPRKEVIYTKNTKQSFTENKSTYFSLLNANIYITENFIIWSGL